MIKTLAFSLICYLGPTRLPSQYSENQIVEIVNNFTFITFSSGSQFVGETENRNSPFCSGTEVSCLVTIAFQFPEASYSTRMFILVCAVNLVLSFLNQIVGNATQRCAPRNAISGWQGVWEN